MDKTSGVEQDDSDKPDHLTEVRTVVRVSRSSARQSLIVPMAVPALSLGLPSVAEAAPVPIEGCANGYELMTVKEINKTIMAPGFEDYIIAKDANGDGYLCIHIIPNDGGPKQFSPAFVYADNQTSR